MKREVSKKEQKEAIKFLKRFMNLNRKQQLDLINKLEKRLGK